MIGGDPWTVLEIFVLCIKCLGDGGEGGCHKK